MRSRGNMLHSMEKRLSAYMESRIYPSEIATTLNFILFDEFSKAGLKPVFVGQYAVDPANPGQTRVFCHQGTEACSPIPIARGVIGRAIRTGEDQYVADVAADKSHIGCDPDMQGSELVLLSWSESYSSGNFKGAKVPLGALDIDLNKKSALGITAISRLRRIWARYGKLVFPGEPSFSPGFGISVKKGR